MRCIVDKGADILRRGTFIPFSLMEKMVLLRRGNRILGLWRTVNREVLNVVEFSGGLERRVTSDEGVNW